MRRTLQLPLLLAAAGATAAAQPAASPTPRPMRAEDLYRVRTVRDPQRSPDGKWVAYTVATPDSARDRNDTDLWMTSWDGAQTLRLTWTPEPESSPRWSPDNRWLAFVSGRQEGKGGQVWLLDRRGGEAQRVTQIKGGVSDLVWAPDAKRFAVVVDEETDSLARRDTTEKKTPPPIVIDRYAFKRDIAGYLGTKRTRVAVFDLDTRKLDTLAHGVSNDDAPSWSPDGQRIAFQRAVLAEPGHAGGTALYVAPARGGEAVRVSGDLPVTGDRAAWSPDGQTLAFLRGDEPKYSAYVQPALMVVAADGRTVPRAVASRLDRPVSSPTFEPGGASLLVTITDDRRRYLARVRLADGSVSPVLEGRRVVGDYSAPAAAADRGVALLLATPERPGEVYALDGGAEPRQLSHQNDSLFAALAVSPTEDVVSRSADGTEVHSLLLRPPGQPNATRLPLLLYIHGGPNGQDQYEFNLTRQFLAARGYAVLAVNYRGSNGRGAAYQKAIYADWGNKEVVDILGAVDRVVATGVADSARMGIGGWSYGGILTDYTIATTRRFKAAISGAGSALQLSMYGADQYVTQYEHELGAPWQKQDLWIKLSYPFFHADRIATPTLFMVGERDFNVPAIGSEQMYQALRTLGVQTQLVIYPNQFHGLTVPSYLVDRMRRWVGWYDRWLQPRPAAAAAAATQ